MNSGPLSKRSRLGAPRSSTKSSSARMTRAEGRLVSISIFIDSRLKSSLMLKMTCPRGFVPMSGLMLEKRWPWKSE